MSTGKYIPPHLRRKLQKDDEAGASTEGSATANRTRFGSFSTTDNSGPRRDVHHRHQAQQLQQLLDAFTLVYCINLRRRPDRWESFVGRLKAKLGDSCQPFVEKVQRFDAVDGAAVLTSMESDAGINDDDLFPRMDWDASKNALYDRHIQPPMLRRMTPGEVGCAMSHAKLWRLLEARHNPSDTMLILEDDAVFYDKSMNKHSKYSNRADTRQNYFLEAFSSLWQVLPADWDILYLGMSWRGEKVPVVDDGASSMDNNRHNKTPVVKVEVFRPTYGFHTHAYALTKSAAETLLQNGPVCGPLDVWLADNEWFGLNVYCGVVANEGYNKEGALLISQRKHDTKSDIVQSGRVDEEVSR